MSKFEQLNQMIYEKNIPAACTLASEYVTVSVGVIQTKIEEKTSFDDIFRLADNALYQAKNSGRNKIVTCVEKTEE